jgi:hypothetical protein
MAAEASLPQTSELNRRVDRAVLTYPPYLPYLPPECHFFAVAGQLRTTVIGTVTWR